MPERLVLIVNPAATRSRAGLLQRTEATLRPAGLAEVLHTERGGHAADLAARAVESGATIVAVLGGDGTANEVAGTLAGTATAMLPIAGGSTNVLARVLGWAHPADRALGQLEAALAHPQTRELQLARVRAGSVDRIVCVGVGIGVDAATIHAVEAHPWIKTRFRNLGVAITAAATFARNARAAPTLRVRVDEAEPLQAATVVVACGSPYTYMGSRAVDLAPGADFGPRLRWIALTSNAFRRAVATGIGALRGARHLTSADIQNGWAGESVVIDSDGPVAVQADGEPLGWHSHIEVTPGPVLRTIVPGGAQVPRA